MGDDFSNSPIQLQGQLLLASPALHDGVFDRSVILLAEHSLKEGAFGLVLNHPTGHVVGDLLTDESFAPLRQVSVHFGGPVARDQLTFSAFWWSQEHKRLRWAIRIPAEEAAQRSHQPGTLVRAYVGYSGWSPGQLENELQLHSWIAARPHADLFGQTHDKSLWAEILRHLSPYHRLISEAPEDPFMN